MALFRPGLLPYDLAAQRYAMAYGSFHPRVTVLILIQDLANHTSNQ